MKLSEMTTDKALDKVCELMPHIANIMKNKQIKNIIISKVEVKKNDKAKDIRSKAYDMGVSKVTELIPLLLREYRNDIYAIISIIDDTELEEIKNQSITVTIKRITELLQDKDLIKLFT